MNKTTEPAALAGIEPVAWAHEQGPNKLVDAYNKSKHPESFAYFTEPLYSAATVERLVQERNGWIDSAREFSNGMEYYRGQLDACARHIGLPCFTADDGGVHEEPLRAKVAEEVERLVQERDQYKHIAVAPMKYRRMELNAQLQNELAAMTQERDQWKQLAANCELAEEQVSSSYQLAASQAREQQLRDALEFRGVVGLNDTADQVIRSALSLPQDDTALKAWGEKLLREIADGCRDGIDRAWITSKADELMEEKGNG